MLREYWKRRQKDGKSQRIREFALRLCLLVISEARYVKYHHHECENVSRTRTPAIDMP